MEIDLKIARAKTKLMLQYPFWGSLATSLRFQASESVPTAATDGLSIFYNVDFVDKLTEPQLIGLVAHEVCHVALKHHLRMQDRDPHKWNYATDFAINETLLGEGFELPDGGLVDEQYRNMASEVIYNQLPEEKDYSNEDLHVLSPKNGDGSDMTEDQLKEAEQAVNRQLKVAAETAKAVGKLPSGMKDIIDELLDPKICWRSLLRLHVLGKTPKISPIVVLIVDTFRALVYTYRPFRRLAAEKSMWVLILLAA